MNLDTTGIPKDNRMTAIGLAATAALLLAFAAFSRSWVSRPPPMDVGFGPLGCTNCGLIIGDEGGNLSNGEFIAAIRKVDPDSKTASSAFSPMGYATFALCVISALGLLAAVGLAYQKKRPDLPVAPTTVAMLGLMGSLITGCVFVATKPGGPGFVGVSMGFWAFGVGSVLGIVGAQMLAKVIRPVDPDLLEGAMDADAY